MELTKFRNNFLKTLDYLSSAGNIETWKQESGVDPNENFAFFIEKLPSGKASSLQYLSQRSGRKRQNSATLGMANALKEYVKFQKQSDFVTGDTIFNFSNLQSADNPISVRLKDVANHNFQMIDKKILQYQEGKINLEELFCYLNFAIPTQERIRKLTASLTKINPILMDYLKGKTPTG